MKKNIEIKIAGIALVAVFGLIMAFMPLVSGAVAGNGAPIII